ncbi:MAG: peroxiredoxin, partial [Spirochaetales bacterium]|nr:peroxiredoxin [Spirochaetales bacterium]
KEACSFRDAKPDFDNLNAVVIGVSKDSAKAHRSFIEKQSLNFMLLTDEKAEVLEKYEAWGEKSMYGKKYMGIIRCTYVIDENGMIIKTYPKVSVATHGQDVKNFLESIK